MNEDIVKKIKSLFDYQKFEGDPKLNQVINDSLKDDISALSDFDLNVVTGGSYIRTNIHCTNCGGEKTLIHLIDTSNNKEYYKCYRCGFHKEIDNK